MQPIRAVAYPRYSSDNQREESIDAQMRAIEAYCLKKGYVLVGSYPDEAQSAKTDDRPNFQRMISDSAKGLFDVVIVHKLNRFARNRYDSAIYKRRLKKNGVRVESVTQQLDDSPESIILESVLEGMDEYYSKDLARETRKGLIENASTGRHTGGRPPYGYKVNPETLKLEVDENKAPAVRFYFESIAQGMQVVKIAQSLNEMGYRTYSGGEFTKNSFWDWSKNKKYIGIFTWDVATARTDEGRRNYHNKKPESEQIQIAGAVPPIISVELFEKVNQIMEQRKHKPGTKKAKLVYLLSERVFCGNPECDGVCRGGSYDRNGKRFAYYKCANHCGYKSIRKDDLEHAVIQQVTERVFTHGALQVVVKRVQELYQQQRKSQQVNLQPLHKELSEITHKIDNWLEAIGEGLLDKTVLAEKIRTANQRKAAIEIELERIRIMEEQSNLSDDMILAVLNKKKEQLFSGDEEAKKQVLQEIVEAVTVLHDRSSDSFNIDLIIRFFTGVEDGT